MSNIEILKKRSDYIRKVYEGIDSAKHLIIKYDNERDGTYQNRLEDASLLNITFKTIDNIVNTLTNKLNVNEEINKQFSFSKYFLHNLIKDISRELLITGNCIIICDKTLIIKDINTLIDYEKDLFYIFSYEEGTITYSEDNVVIKDEEGKVIDEKECDELLVKHLTYNNTDIYDLTKLNVQHLNRSSELNTFLRNCARPIPVIHTTSNVEEVSLGLDNGLRFDGSKSDEGFYYVELEGKSTLYLETRLDKLEQNLREVSLSLISSLFQKTATEIESSNNSALNKLHALALIIESFINECLRTLAIDDVIESFTLNKTFLNKSLTVEQLNQYRLDYTNGLISYDTLMSVLVSNNVYSIDIEAEKEKLHEV